MEGHNAQPAPNAQKLNYNCPHLELNKLVFVMTRADQTVNYEMLHFVEYSTSSSSIFIISN